jgi:putative heme-binding domain-containing protein
MKRSVAIVFAHVILVSTVPAAEPQIDLRGELPKVDYSSISSSGQRGHLQAEGNTPAFIGSSAGKDEFFHGDLDDLRIYSAGLGVEDIRALAAGKEDVAIDAITGWWRFDGDLTNDASGSARAANHLGGDPTFAEGRLGKALRLDGRQTARVENYSRLKPRTGKMTVSAWIRPTQLGNDWYEIYRKEDGGARQLLALGKTGFFGLWCGLGIDDGYVEFGAPIKQETLTDGNWHHVAMAYDGKTISLFHNGQAVGQENVIGDGAEPEGGKADEKQLRIAFLGNTLIHRMTEFGYLEAELTRLHPDKDISFRNLGWPADTIAGEARTGFGPTERNRSSWRRPAAEFGDYGFRRMLEQIRREQPNVLLVGYGSNVAFKQEKGLEEFKTGLKKLLDTLKPTGVKVILLAPPPREGTRGQLTEQNEWLEKVTAHLKATAAEGGHAFIDLFHSWPKRQGISPPLTDNGIHLNARGYKHVAGIIARHFVDGDQSWLLHMKADGTAVKTVGTKLQPATKTQYGMRWKTHDEKLPSINSLNNRLRVIRIEGLGPGWYALDIDGRRVAHGTAKQFGEGVAITRSPNIEQLDRLRETINRKNRLHFYGFRPQNRAYIHLFRRHERGHHAAEIERFALLVREAEQEIAALRAPVARHYELVREKDYADHEVPSESVTPNIEKELASFNIPDGFEISLFASDPMIANPINMNWDERGRMWVATSTIYPHLQPGQTPNDQILILEDIDKDGRADKRTVFADKLLIPHSVIVGHGGAFVTQSTDVLYLRDTDGDGRADERRVLLTGFGNADVHHMIHALRWGPGGDLYFNQSIYINSIIETPWGIRRSNGSCIWRLRPETLRLETLMRGLVNPWGHAFDDWGQSFATDGAGGGGLAYTFPGSAFVTHGDYSRNLPSMNRGRPKECGLEMASGRHLPESWRGTFLTNDFRANRTTRYRLTESGSGYKSEFLGDMVSSRHRAFRPVDVKMGPDGAIYICDWYNLIIDHGEVDFHHPLRDKRHGRIWRLSVKGAPLVEPPKLAGASTKELLDVLKLPEQWTRDQARRLLRERQPKMVVPEVQSWLAGLSRDDPKFEHHRLEALWVCQGLRTANAKLLAATLASPDYHVRAAAVRVLGDWQDRLPDSKKLFAAATADPHPRVRLEAVNALRDVGTREAVELATRALDHPLDGNIDFAAWRTVRDLRSEWLEAFQRGDAVFDGQPHRLAFALSAVGGEASLAPLAQLVRDNKLQPKQRANVLKVLAALGGRAERTLVIDALPSLGPQDMVATLQAFADAKRGEVPENGARIILLLEHENKDVRTLASRIAGRWRLADGQAKLNAVAASPTTDDAERLAAGHALLQIDRNAALATLQQIYDKTADIAVRATAVAAWAAGDSDKAAGPAAQLLATTKRIESAEVVFDAFVIQKNGPNHLARELAGKRLLSSLATRGVQLAAQSGRDLAPLTEALTKAGGLKPLPPTLTAEEIAGILRDVGEKGDPTRGASVFQRRELNCAQCHAVGGKGGQVGPDLSSLGGSARLADILQSIVNPNAKIKEGYQTTEVITGDGRIVTGVVVQRTPTHIQLRDAKDRVITIPNDEIDELSGSAISIMPRGLTKSLRRDELVDLLRYLSALGRE